MSTNGSTRSHSILKALSAVASMLAGIALIVGTLHFLQEGKEIELVAFCAGVLIVLSTLATMVTSTRIDDLCLRIERRKPILRTLGIFLFGLLLTQLLAASGIQSNQKQLEIANRETAPTLFMSVEPGYDGNSIYKLSTDKGIASSVSISPRESYRFSRDGQYYDFSISFESSSLDGRTNLAWNENELAYSVRDQGFSSDIAQWLIDATLGQKGIDTSTLYRQSYVEVTFFDYQNESHMARFTLNDGTPTLSVIDPYATTSEKNIRIVYRPEANLDQAITSALDYLIE